MLVLGIETTCDEPPPPWSSGCRTDAAGFCRISSCRKPTSMRAFGGVVPEIAARAHVEALDLIIGKAVQEAGTGFVALDGIAAASGPGLIGGVIVGLTTAKGHRACHQQPLIAVNHLEAHALTARLTDAVPFPYCLFLASGGHTQILAVRGVGDYVLLGNTMDDANRRSVRQDCETSGLGLSRRSTSREGSNAG